MACSLRSPFPWFATPTHPYSLLPPLDPPSTRRYRLDPTTCSAETFVADLAEQRYQGDKEKAGMCMLTDYRKGLLGPFALEVPSDAVKVVHAAPAGKKGGGGAAASAGASAVA